MILNSENLIGNFATTMVENTLEWKDFVTQQKKIEKENIEVPHPNTQSDKTWDEFLAQQKTAQKSKEQQHMETPHANDNSVHSHDIDHDNTSHKNDSNGGAHTNDPSKDSHSHSHGNHSNDTHSNHYGSHIDKYNHKNDGYREDHTNIPAPHTDKDGHNHTNSTDRGQPGHGDSYNQRSHTNEYAHKNNAGHDDDDHNDGTTHSNIPGHTNFVPNVPSVYNIVDNQTVQASAALNIGLYSYDANIDGLGTNDTQSKQIYFDFKARKIKNIDGTSNVSGWVNHLTKAISNNGAYQFSLNTMDLLKSGNTNPANSEGYYELQSTAYNVIKGVIQSSSVQTHTIIVYNDVDSKIEVLNPEEFINFTFNYDGILTSGNIYKNYGTNFSGIPAEKQSGIAVRIKLSDTTAIQQWQKANIYLINSYGTKITKQYHPVIWNDGNQITSVYKGSSITGVGFIPESDFSDVEELQNAKLTIEVQEYKDAGCNILEGSKITQTKVSQSNTKEMTINIDNCSPNRITFITSPAGYVVTQSTGTIQVPAKQDIFHKANINAGFSVMDGQYGSGIKQLFYKTTQSAARPSSWSFYSANSAINLTADGVWYVHYKAIDKINNEHYGYAIYKIDKTAPTYSSPILVGDALKFTVTDTGSGLKSIKFPDGITYNYTGQHNIDITIPVDINKLDYLFTFEDIAGNISTLNYKLQLTTTSDLSIAGIIRSPDHHVFPILTPTSTPIDIKAGYNITLDVKTFGTDKVTLKFMSETHPILVRTSIGSIASQITKATVSNGSATTRFVFWVNEAVPLSTVIDVDIQCEIMIGGNHISKTNSTFGHHLFKIVGSAERDASVNQTY